MLKILHLFRYHWFIFVFAIAYVVLAFATYKTYPIANGEEFRYLRGKETLVHFTQGQFVEKMVQPTPNYFLYNLYPMILVALNPKFYYEWFHLMNLLFSTLAFVAAYLLALELMKSRKKAALAVIALLLFPGFFGQMAINPIDMPFMVCYLFLLLALVKYSNKEAGHWSTLLLGLLFGVTQGLRQLGLTLYVVMVILDLYDYFSVSRSARPLLKNFVGTRVLKYIFIFIIANFFMVVTWPNFAVNFFKNYYWYLFVGSNFYLWDFGLLFMGNFLENWQRPWYYLPLFQLITYPVYISALFLATFVFIKAKLRNRAYFIVVATLAINYLLYFALHPVLYDGIRHFLYLIPLITLLSIDNLFSILDLLKQKFMRWVLVAVVVVNMIVLGAYTVREFPYIYAYFNNLAWLFGNPYQQFESDYSSTKYREASEWIRDVYLKENPQYNVDDPKLMLKVYPCDNAYAVDYFSHKEFLTVIHKEEADLILCDYRNLKQSGYQGKLINEFKLSNSKELLLLRRVYH